jgi:uncharacterized membrane protein YheB (UPF0754 family)
VDSVVFELLNRPVTVGTLLIPVFSGVIGMVTNWVALKMMFYPLEWVGWRLPFKVGIGRYKFPVIGWQGVIPSKAAKMGSIAVDTGLAKLGSMYDFYQTFEPEVIAAHVVETSRDEIHAVVDQIIQRQYPELWAAAPPQVRQMVHRRVEHEMPDIVREVLDGIGHNIDRLIDLKLMVIRHLEANPRMANRIFQDVGEKEFRFITRSGLYFGFLLGIAPMLVYLFVTQHGLAVPVGAALVGYLTNWIALRVIFQPLEPHQVGPFRIHGLFLKRQDEVAEAYSDLIAYEVVTLPNIARQMLDGPDGDRTRRLIADTVGPVLDDAIGMARPLVKAAARGKYDVIKDAIAEEAMDQTADVLLDDAYARERARGMQALLAERMRSLPPREFAGMLRAAFEQDEWMLIMVGALLGLGAGALQVVFTL